MKIMVVVLILFIIVLPAHSELKSIESALKTKINSEIIYTYVPRGLVVSINENMLFDDTNEKISRRGILILNSIAEVINSSNHLCIIEGHTRDLNYSYSKFFASNWELSLARANNIALYFMRCNRVNPEKLFTIGYGEYMPFHDSVSYKGNLNCRIDFVFLDYGKLSYN